jgi:hypothetical protein
MQIERKFLAEKLFAKKRGNWNFLSSNVCRALAGGGVAVAKVKFNFHDDDFSPRLPL